MEGDAEQPALRRRVHRQVEHHTAYLAVDHPLDLTAGLLDHDHVVVADESHGDRLIETRYRRAHGQVRVEQLRLLRQRRPYKRRLKSRWGTSPARPYTCA
jgi:hypothetical protein